MLGGFFLPVWLKRLDQSLTGLAWWIWTLDSKEAKTSVKCWWLDPKSYRPKWESKVNSIFWTQKLGMGQMLYFTCVELNANEQNTLFSLISIRRMWNTFDPCLNPFTPMSNQIEIYPADLPARGRYYNPGQNCWHIPPPPHSTLNRGEGGEKRIVLGSSAGYTMCMTDDISKNGQN